MAMPMSCFVRTTGWPSGRQPAAPVLPAATPEEKDRLADAEIELKQTQQTTGVLQLSGQAQTIIGQEANIHANITRHEVELGALLSSSTEQNPDVVRLRMELSGLRAQLSQLQKGTNGAMLSQRDFPGAGLEYIRKERNVQYHQTLYDLLARQLEAARIDEAKASPTVQMVDPPLVPKGTSWPKPFLFIIVGLVLGTMFGSSAGSDLCVRYLETSSGTARALYAGEAGYAALGAEPRCRARVQWIAHGFSRSSFCTSNALRHP